MPVIRPGEPGDLEAVAAIQAASPQAAHWPVDQYLLYGFTVATCDGAVVGFLVWRTLVPGECEVLNLAVDAGFRRRGIARALIAPLVAQAGIAAFLEVRESNLAARVFYQSMGFHEVGARQKYYNFPSETAIVMKFHSC